MCAYKKSYVAEASPGGTFVTSIIWTVAGMADFDSPERKSKRKQLRENWLVTLYAQAWLYYDQNKQKVYAGLAGVVVLILAGVGIFLYLEQQEETAQQHLDAIVPLYERGQYQAALDGTADALGLVEIADQYGRTDAGNMARFYAGDAFFQVGDHDQALSYFRDFNKSDDFVGAGALAAQAAIYEDRGDFAEAAELYREAAFQFENTLTSPRYLLNAGRAFEQVGDLQSARAAYEDIREHFPDSELSGDVDRYLARVDAKQQGGAS